ncbi:MAG TPA: trypsin-like peptidase domain-containing protein [Burkholderiales bacterium]|nr:trypsin-like peptidase domain-containing protein [Burkholderiales bacterium]
MRALRLAALGLAALAGAARAEPCTQSIADIYEAKSPAVVLITAMTINPYRKEDRIEQATGSGFIIDAHGLVMTNSHVVFGAQAISVTLDDGTTLTAKLVGADPIFDLAVLRIPPPEKGELPVLEFGDSDELRPGDQVVAIGNPLGLEQTITSGIVSALNRILPERPLLLTWPMIQTDAAINPGNSGGPLLNRCGQVVGIASQILGNAQNIGFAIPSNLARAAVGELVAKGRLVRPWLGIDGGLVDGALRQVLALPLADGFLVEAVEPNSPAALAGIRGGRLPVRIGTRSMILGGDVIVEMNGEKLLNPDALERALGKVHIGSKVTMKVFRAGATREVEFPIVERPLQPGDVPESSQSFPVEQQRAPGADTGK